MTIKLGGTEFAIIHRTIDTLIILGSLCFTSYLYLGHVSNESLLAAAFAILAFLVCSESLGLYRSWRTYPIAELLTTTVLSWVMVVVSLLAVAYLTKVSESYSRVATGSWFVLTPILLCALRICLYLAIFHARNLGYNRRRAIIIGTTESGIQLAKEFERSPNLGIDLVGFFDDRDPARIDVDSLPGLLLGPVKEGLTLTRSGDVDHVYIAMPMKAEERNAKYLSDFSDTTANTYVIPDFFVYNLIQSRLSAIGNMPILSVHDTPFYGFSTWIKRAQDIVFATLILLLIAPILTVVALGVKLSSPGPIIFKQKRYGLDGRQIEVWKFRSMRAMDNGAVVKQATQNDPRVTKFGAFIRRTSLDELPQFFNVLQGQMSIVGPRPHAVAHNEEYRAIVDRYMLRHKVKPGITGLAQISGYRGETDTLDKMEKRVEYDLKYIESWSLWLDIKIIFMTVFKGFVGKTAY